MSSCILCLKQIRKTGSFKLTEEVATNVTLWDAISHQIQLNIFPPYTSSPSQLTCRNCFQSFEIFYKFLSNIKSNLIDTKADNTFNLIPSNELIFKLEPELIVASDTKCDSMLSTIDEYSEDEDNFDWNCTDPIDDEYEEEKIEDIKNKNSEDSDGDYKVSRNSRTKVKVVKRKYKNSEESDEDYEVAIKKKKTKNPKINEPYVTETGWTRYLPKHKLTQEILDSGKNTVTIKGKVYKIPERTYTVNKPKKVKPKKVIDYSDPTKRKHPAHDPEGEEFIRTHIDIRCYSCNIQEESFTKLKTHFHQQHPNDNFYLACCNRKFHRRFELVEHLEYHYKTTIFHCKICDKTYKTKKNLDVHNQYYHNSDARNKVICDECGKILNNVHLLKNHMKYHIKDTSKIFECYICKDSKEFRSLIHLKGHMRNKHTTNKQNRKTVCHICSATIRESYLQGHIKAIHGDELRERLQCNICNDWLLKKNFKAHVLKHNDMGINCNVCGKFLKSKYSLPLHMKVAHSNDYKFRCQFCDKGFFRLVKMKEHVAVRHTREFPFACRVTGCSRQFRSEANWRNHEKKMHPVEYDKLFKPFYKRDNKELKEFAEMMDASGDDV